MVVAAYGLILPQWVLDAPARGCFNIHASLLPRWRGAAPIHRAIEAGDSEAGITIMQMDAGLDTGDMLFMHTTPITGRDTTGTLHDRLADLGGKLMVLALNEAAAGRLKPVPQPAEGVTYAHKIEKAESAVDWSLPAAQIQRRIRAFDPFPGASSALGGETVKLWQSHVDSMERPSDAGNGQILAANSDGVRVACGDGVLCVTQLQRAGGKRLAAADFLRGFPLNAGATFDAPPAGA
jgi:methionyl-tRNA formyltransferase